MGRLMVLLLFALAGALQGHASSAASERMLVFTRTAGYRHDSIPAAVAAIRDLAARHGIAVEHTEVAQVNMRLALERRSEAERLMPAIRLVVGR